MKRATRFILAGLMVFIVCIFGPSHHTAAQSAATGFTINTFRSLNELSQLAYVRGFMEGFIAGAVFESPGRTALKVAWAKCTDRFTYDQDLAIFAKWIQAHPEFWHQDPSAGLLVALSDVCAVDWRIPPSITAAATSSAPDPSSNDDIDKKAEEAEHLLDERIAKDRAAQIPPLLARPSAIK